MKLFNFMRSARAGFTLIELLVVIGIIGILSGVLLTTFGGASESAMAAKCMTNIRNLAVAAHSAAMTDGGYFPAAGPYEFMGSSGYEEVPGWITWNRPRPPRGTNPYKKERVRGHNRGPQSTKVSSSWFPYLAYNPNDPTDRDLHREALTNGVLWLSSGRNAESYVCPKHQQIFRNAKNHGHAEAQGYLPCWSYVMNSYFGYDNKGGKSMSWQRKPISELISLRKSLPLAGDKLLLFAEVPFESKCPMQEDIKLVGTDAKFNTVLEYNEKTKGDRGYSGPAEYIGFNHKAGKRWMAHVAFADGHVARLMMPRDANEDMMRELTTWLCQGDEVVFQADKYERVNKVDEDLN